MPTDSINIPGCIEICANLFPNPFAKCISQTLSMNNVTPRGRYVYLDIEKYLEEYENAPESENAAPARELPEESETDS